MKINIKEGVIFREFNDFYLDVIRAVSGVWSATGVVPTITSANDGKHMESSYHYRNKGLDLRIRDLPQTMHKPIREMLQTRLGDRFQVILEKDHIHVEPS